MIIKENLVDLQEKFEKVKKLIEEDAKFDPETTPYFSKYAARQHLISMNALLENLKSSFTENSGYNYNKLVGMHASVQLLLGIIAVDTEELSIGEKHLNECLEIVKDYSITKEVASVALSLYNQLGVLWTLRDPEKGEEYLERGNSFYKQVKENNMIPQDYNDLFIVNCDVSEEEALKKFEKTYTLTLYYLAQVYSQSNPLKSAIFCHKTLQRQLESNDYDHIDWALNTATLSQFLMEKNGFKQARHHLAASLSMLDLYKNKLDSINEHNEEYDAKVEVFKHRSADVARCWGKYGILLLSNSRDRLMNSKDIDIIESVCTDIGDLLIDDNSIDREDLKTLHFPTLDLDVYEEQVTDKFILTMEDARKVFLNAQKWLNKAEEYYTLTTLASDYIEIAQDHSKLYDLLVFFEEDFDNQAKLLKRAVDILENVLKQVNPTYYMQYCQHLWFRLGLFYSNILDIKLDKLKESDSRPNPHSLNKVNVLVEKSIKHFTSFLDSFRNSKGEMPSKIREEFEKAFLQAYFNIAALQTRYISLDKAVLLKNTEKSFGAYKIFVDYCKANEAAENLVQAEMAVAREMVSLLPLKIARIKNELPVSL